MNFIGAFMTVLRLERGSGMLIHTALGSPPNEDVDFSLDMPQDLSGPLGVAGRPDIMIEPAAHARSVHITRGGQDLWADPDDDKARFRDRGAGRFEFLLVDDAALAHLRTLLRHRWVRGLTENGPEITMLPAYAFILDMGKARLDVRANMPRPAASGPGFVLDTDAGEITITPVGPARAEIQLLRRDAKWQPPRTPVRAEWPRDRDGWLQTQFAEEFCGLPITVCDADRDWMYKNPYGAQDQIIGRHRCAPLIAHEANKYVLMSRYAEGVIFDEHGTCNEDGYLEGYGYRGAKPIFSPPDGMRSDHNRLFVDRQVLADAPFVPGDAIVFIVGNLSNYTHWLIDCLLALHLMLDYVPDGAKLLLPGTLRTLRSASRRVVDHYDTLRAFGFDHLPQIEIDAPYCRVEHAYWVEGEAVSNMPATAFRSLRARVAALRPPPARRDGRIYIARRGGRRVANAELLQPFLERQGFTTYYMEDYSIDEQIDMFSQAEWVIGPHGAELGNLLFCRPGTRVLELAPDYDYKPYFSYMCNKLNLSHGVLPCPTTDTSFNGDIILNMGKFAALFRMLKNRL